MKIIYTVNELRRAVRDAKSNQSVIGLVPTMGALHQGHLSLVARARKECDFVIVSVFVNPTQFNNPDDLRTYPRSEEADCELLRQAGADVAFVPSVSEMYPEPDTRIFDLGKVAQVMEGAMRPGHFNGVAQVVSKLFDFTQADRAYFGEKDFQQIAVIRAMVASEGFKTQIVPCPIVRESDGLALSSRNVRLSGEQRAVAPRIHAILAESCIGANEKSVGEVKQFVCDGISAIEAMRLEYFEIVNPTTLESLPDDAPCSDAVGCITVWLGDVRLIDNIKYSAL